MARFHQITIQGETFTFDHLDSTDLTVAIKSGNTTRDIVIIVNFSCHCFTEEHDATIHTPDLIYRHDDEIRAFSRERYELSKALPDIIRRIPAQKVFFSRESNYLTIETVDQEGRKVPYTVFFDLKRARLRGQDLVMTVESAYIKEELPKHLDKIAFRILAAKIFSGQKVVSPQVFQKRK